MKLLLKIVAVVVVILIIAVVGVFVWIDSIAKKAVEAGATSALGVDTSLGAIDIGVFAGKCELEQLVVANPAGFDDPHFFSLGSGGVAVSLGSLLEDTVEVPTLSLSGIDLYLEKKGGKSNYQVIIDNLKKSETAEPEEKTKEGGKKFIIRELTIEDIDAHVHMGPRILTEPVHIDKIVLRNVGSDSDNGVLMDELTGVVIKAVLAAVVKSAANVIPELAGELEAQLGKLEDLGKVGAEMADVVFTQAGEVGEQLGKVAEGISEGGAEGLKKATEGAGDAVGEAAEGAGEAIKGIGDGLGKLFGGDKGEKKDEDE